MKKIALMCLLFQGMLQAAVYVKADHNSCESLKYNVKSILNMIDSSDNASEEQLAVMFTALTKEMKMTLDNCELSQNEKYFYTETLKELQ